MDLKKMLDEAENIDFSAVITRLAGQPLTVDQKEMCARYDALYDATHQGNGGANLAGEQEALYNLVRIGKYLSLTYPAF